MERTEVGTNAHDGETGLEDRADFISADGTTIAGTVNWSCTGNNDHEAVMWSCE